MFSMSAEIAVIADSYVCWFVTDVFSGTDQALQCTTCYVRPEIKEQYVTEDTVRVGTNKWYDPPGMQEHCQDESLHKAKAQCINQSAHGEIVKVRPDLCMA